MGIAIIVILFLIGSFFIIDLLLTIIKVVLSVVSSDTNDYNADIHSKPEPPNS